MKVMTATALPNGAKIVKKTFTPNLMRAIDLVKAKKTDLPVDDNDLSREDYLTYVLLEDKLFLIINVANKKVHITNSDGENICRVTGEVERFYLCHARERIDSMLEYTEEEEEEEEKEEEEDRMADLEDLRYKCYKESKHLVS